MRLNEKKLQTNHAAEIQNPMNNCNFWRFSALASAVALIGCLTSLEASALALGRITVQSSLGQPIKAEVEIPQINLDEISSLKASVASPETFKAAGLSYSSIATDISVSLQKRADGSRYLQLSSTRAINEPFVDLILEAKWSSGRIVRDYTMLFDPPLMDSSRAAAPSNPISLTAPASVSKGKTPAAAPAPVQKTTPAYPATQNKLSEAERKPSPSEQSSTSTALSKPVVSVKDGDTAWRIVVDNTKSGVSLDQMLIALLKLNPNAFMDGNVNRLKSGSVLEMPGTEQAQATPPLEARRMIRAQSADFNDFRRKLAQSVGIVDQRSEGRELGGKLQAKVEDRAANTVTPDKLTLSKGSVQGKNAVEEKIANDRQAAENAARISELSKNIAELKRLTGEPSTTVASNASTSPDIGKSANGLALTVPSLPVLPTPVPASAASQPSSPAANTAATDALASNSAAGSAIAAAGASSPALVTPAMSSASAANKPAPKANFGQSLTDSIRHNTLFLPGMGLMVLLLGGLGFYRYRQRRNLGQVDSSFMESRIQPDSFFGASGGQRIDTSDGSGTGSSLVYSPSQLDAGGDVDPVAEADVYLAYGRDLQAEEILTEALRSSPVRVAIHAKLLEIYAKRRDIKAFEGLAKVASKLTHNVGPEWDYICKMGREIDPKNALYKEGSPAAQSNQPATENTASKTQPATEKDVLPSVQNYVPKKNRFNDKLEAQTTPQEIAQASTPQQLPETKSKPPATQAEKKTDAALDISLDDLVPAPIAPIAPAAPKTPTTPEDHAPQELLNTAGQTKVSDTLSKGLDADAPSATYAPSSAPAELSAPKTSPPAREDNVIEFDMGALSLDLEPSKAKKPAPKTVFNTQSPLETKLALAEEFRAIGDEDGARALAKEVLAESTGALKNKALAFINFIP